MYVAGCTGARAAAHPSEGNLSGHGSNPHAAWHSNPETKIIVGKLHQEVLL